MPTIRDMTTSLQDASFFNDKIEAIVRGPEQQHDLAVVRRYFRGYLHCWKTVLYLVREARALVHGPKIGTGSLGASDGRQLVSIRPVST